jgi:hypothetical protein
MDHQAFAQLLGSYGEFVGAIAVVATLVYLAIQVRHGREATVANNRLLRSQSHYNALEACQRPFEVMLESESLAEILMQCDKSPYELKESDWSKCVNYFFMQVNGWEYTYYQHLEEAVPPSLWLGVDAYFGNEARTRKGWVRFWKETADGVAEPFRSHVDRFIQSNPESNLEPA